MLHRFHVGQRVVCVDDRPLAPEWRWTGHEVMPVRGAAYVIREVNPKSGGVRLAEVINAPAIYQRRNGRGVFIGELWFHYDRFRPIEPEASIEVFTDILRQPERELEDA